MRFKSIGAAIVTASLLVSSAFAVETAPTPLAAGKPAGTKDAALLAASPLLLIGAVALVVVIAVAASNGSDNNKTSTTTGTTS